MNSKIRNVVVDYYSDRLLESYGIYIFSLNESVSPDIQQYKQGVIKAIKKMKSKIGDSAGNIVSNLINNAKKQGHAALIAVLMSLSIFAGAQDANAHMSEKQANLFTEHCAQLYDGEKVLKSRIYNDILNQRDSMINDENDNYYSGYAVNSNQKLAMSQARKQALDYYKADHGSYPDGFDVDYVTNLATEGYRVIAIIKVSTNPDNNSIKKDEVKNDTMVKKEIDLSLYVMYTGKSKPFTASPENTRKAMVEAYKVAIEDYNTQNGTHLTSKQLDEMGSELKFTVSTVKTQSGPQQVCTCKLYVPKN